MAPENERAATRSSSDDSGGSDSAGRTVNAHLQRYTDYCNTTAYRVVLQSCIVNHKQLTAVCSWPSSKYSCLTKFASNSPRSTSSAYESDHIRSTSCVGVTVVVENSAEYSPSGFDPQVGSTFFLHEDPFFAAAMVGEWMSP